MSPNSDNSCQHQPHAAQALRQEGGGEEGWDGNASDSWSSCLGHVKLMQMGLRRSYMTASLIQTLYLSMIHAKHHLVGFLSLLFFLFTAATLACLC